LIRLLNRWCENRIEIKVETRRESQVTFISMTPAMAFLVISIILSIDGQWNAKANTSRGLATFLKMLAS
jgi:hypothetical protein